MTGVSMRPRNVAFLLVAAGVALLAFANAHLVYVAVKSQPECVAHTKQGTGTPGTYSAARSAC
ncbi:hypothetical protein [Sinorhizobium sp. BG8]|uniref:hypothetical protein n=1 Tax=Sinorhizobium sp. BG8 TaxID=2613773 RepID=UPI00193C92A2|nr:hypothetical protein [Sinorhizobium sp. BG8]QRM55897.1 hypothetical protein F3Y30_16195 [Sinorhizobium sp. BG8]